MPRSDSAPDVPGTTRRDLSVARVIDPARERAETRVQRFLDAAFELMASTGKDFTLQEVVERSGLSLRSFYQYFNGKHELLLALLEDSIRRNEEQLRAAADTPHAPVERLHGLVATYDPSGRHSSATKAAPKVRVPALAEFAQQLLSDH